MKTQLNSFAVAGFLAASVALAPGAASAGVRICTFPGSPSTALDRAVALEAFKTAGIAASVAGGAFAGSDDDGVSPKELGRALAHRCDVIAGVPHSSVADGDHSSLLFSRGYLRSGYVSVTAQDSSARPAAADVVAAMYASPAQLIAVQQRDVTLDLENTSAATIDAVANGHAQRAIVWYPAVVAYLLAHPKQHLAIAGTASPYADWHLAFGFGANNTGLQKRVDAALGKMAADGRLAALTRNWALPETLAAALGPAASYRDGPLPSAAAAAIKLTSASLPAQGGFMRISASVGGDAPSFDRSQVAHGKSLYAGSCAKCHGANLEGVTAPALRGPAFAPAANSHLTVGGVFRYMANNMPADRPGKMKPEDYADIMSFLLYSNGYSTGTAKMTADSAKASATPLNAGPRAQ